MAIEYYLLVGDKTTCGKRPGTYIIAGGISYFASVTAPKREQSLRGNKHLPEPDKSQDKKLLWYKRCLAVAKIRLKPLLPPWLQLPAVW
ncbi:hypothetical protein [Photorhabdus aegyptia]|uniref:hypothetical protein n=1 Tax=Photorhabdus aegyptia TaxID=2805098 RepID=UPI0030B80DED|nr:hypothetical protein [Photorhabdus aegyptia]